MSRGIPIHVIGIDKGWDAPTLATIARGSHGTFHSVPDWSRAPATTNHILTQARQLIFESVSMDVEPIEDNVVIEGCNTTHKVSHLTANQAGPPQVWRVYFGDWYARESRSVMFKIRLPLLYQGVETQPQLRVRLACKPALPVPGRSALTRTIETGHLKRQLRRQTVDERGYLEVVFRTASSAVANGLLQLEMERRRLRGKGKGRATSVAEFSAPTLQQLKGIVDSVNAGRIFPLLGDSGWEYKDRLTILKTILTEVQKGEHAASSWRWVWEAIGAVATEREAFQTKPLVDTIAGL